jgi:hypothetical protein
MINFETGWIPFKYTSLNLADWDTYFRSWIGYVKGWRDWYLRVFAKNRKSWEQYKINQCIALSLSEMSRNESLLIATSYLWSDALNAFLFGHGPMAPTLVDVLLLTCLDISSPDVLFSCRNENQEHRWMVWLYCWAQERGNRGSQGTCSCGLKNLSSVAKPLAPLPIIR